VGFLQKAVNHLSMYSVLLKKMDDVDKVEIIKLNIWKNNNHARFSVYVISLKTILLSNMTWGSHGGDYEDGCFLGSSAM
jgi:hypothetical protein